MQMNDYIVYCIAGNLLCSGADLSASSWVSIPEANGKRWARSYNGGLRRSLSGVLGQSSSSELNGKALINWMPFSRQMLNGRGKICPSSVFCDAVWVKYLKIAIEKQVPGN